MDIKNSSLLQQQAYINGKWVNATNNSTFPVINPATQTKIGDLANLSAVETKQAISIAEKVFFTWRDTPIKERAAILRRWAQLIRDNLDDLAIILTTEQGKPLAEARNEINAAAEDIDWAAEEVKRVYGDVMPPFDNNIRNMVIKQPIGVVGTVTPWNFPSATVTSKIAPAIAAGCTVVLKPSKETPYSALALAALSETAGIPAGVLNVITSAQADIIGQELTQNPIIKMITFTGSTETGRLFMRQAADTVKKVALELGGNAPFIVFADADLDLAVTNALTRKFSNAGQICVSANRFLIHDNLYDAFITKLNKAMDKIKVGNGMQQDTTMGPLVNMQGLEKIEQLIKDAVTHGAQIIRGGNRHKLGDTFFEPTLITGVTHKMAIAQQEIFGPVAAIQRFRTEEEAIKLANDTHYGLASYCFTQDISRLFRVAESLEYGSVGVNTVNFSTIATPFGGVKQSGIGREGGKQCIDAYCESKSIGIKI